MPRRTLAQWVFPLFLLLAGCGEKPTTVAGKVSYNGEPVESGGITFLPSGGKGQVLGADIKNGGYRLENAAVGSYAVSIRGTSKIDFGRSSEEAARLAAEAQAAGRSGGASSNYIPEDAQGNNTTVEIASGDQMIDFALTGPSRQ